MASPLDNMIIGKLGFVRGVHRLLVAENEEAATPGRLFRAERRSPLHRVGKRLYRNLASCVPVFFPP